MLTRHEEFSQLLSLTQIYLLREFKLDDLVFADKPFVRQLKKQMTGTPDLVVKKSALITSPVRISAEQDTPDAMTGDEVIASAIADEPGIADEVVAAGRKLTNEVITAQKSKPVQPPLLSLPAPQKAVEVTPKKIEIPPKMAAPTPQPPVVSEKKQFVLDSTQAPTSTPVDLSYKEILKEHFPQFTLSDHIPSDLLAKKEKEAWLIKQQILPVLILSFYEDVPCMTLLKNMAKAISLRLAPAKVVNGVEFEKEQQWDKVLSNPELRFVISGDYGLYLQPSLMKHYHQDPKTGTHYLNKTPLLLLSDISLYLKKPELKGLLWNAICNEFQIAKGQ